MKPLYVLLGSFLVAIIIQRLLNKPIDFHLSGRIAMSVMLVFTAIGHFAFSKGMTEMIPDFLPYKSQIVFLTGIMEILFAIGLLFPAYQTITAWALIAFLLLVLPANIKASIENINYQTGASDGPGLSYLWLRIPLQIFFIGWIYLSAIKK